MSATPTQDGEYTELDTQGLPQQQHSELVSATPTPDVKYTDLDTQGLQQQQHSELVSATPTQDVEYTELDTQGLPQQQHSETQQHLHLGWPEEECYTEAQLKTKHGRTIARLLGTTQTVVEFDMLRHSLKMSSKKPTTSQKKKHEKLLAQLQ